MKVNLLFSLLLFLAVSVKVQDEVSQAAKTSTSRIQQYTYDKIKTGEISSGQTCDPSIISYVYYVISTCGTGVLKGDLYCILTSIQRSYPGTSWQVFAYRPDCGAEYWINIVDGCAVILNKDGLNYLVYRSS